MERTYHHLAIENQQVSVKQYKIASESYNEGKDWEDGIEYLCVSLVLLGVAFGCILESFDLTVLLTEAFNDSDAVQNVLKQMSDLCSENPQLAVSHIYILPEASDYKYYQRYRNEDEQTHDPVKTEQYNERQNE